MGNEILELKNAVGIIVYNTNFDGNRRYNLGYAGYIDNKHYSSRVFHEMEIIPEKDEDNIEKILKHYHRWFSDKLVKHKPTFSTINRLPLASNRMVYLNQNFYVFEDLENYCGVHDHLWLNFEDAMKEIAPYHKKILIDVEKYLNGFLNGMKPALHEMTG